MRKFITLAGIIVVAAIAIAWSNSTLDRSKVAGQPEATSASIPVAEITAAHGRNLPVEDWTDPF